MANEAGIEGGLIGKIKSLIPTRGSKSTAPVAPKPVVKEPIAVPEKTPTLSPFEELENFLAEQSGITNTGKGPREVLIRKKVFLQGFDSAIKQPTPFIIGVSQNYRSLDNWGVMSVSISSPIDNPYMNDKYNQYAARLEFERIQSAKHALFDFRKNANSTDIILGKDKPFATISFDPDNVLGRTMGGTSVRGFGPGLDVEMGLDKREWTTNRESKFHDVSPHEPTTRIRDYTTDNLAEVAKIVGFVLRAGSEPTISKNEPHIR